LTAIVTLAVSIGVNASVFGVVNAVLFKGFPLVHDNDRLLYLTSSQGCCASYPDFREWREQATSFKDMALTHGIAAAFNDGDGYAERYESTEVSPNTFSLVGVRPLLGRDFAPDDETVGAPAVAILNYSFWVRRFNRDPAVIGRGVRVNGVATQIVGVMPAGFSFPQNVDFWVPLVLTPQVRERGYRNTWFAVGRLADGVGVEAARAEMDTIRKRQELDHPETNRGLPLFVSTFREFFIGANAPVLYRAMWGAGGFVLLIACANLANLLLARSFERTRENSMRFALGASRWRVVRLTLVESVILAVVGGALACLVGRAGLLLFALAPSGISDAIVGTWFDRVQDYSIDLRVLLYVAAASVAATFLFGLLPALRASQVDVNAALRDGSRGATSSVRSRRLSSLLVMAEMALALVLLAGAGAFVRSFQNAAHLELGFDKERLLVAAINLPSSRYAGEPAQRAFFAALRERLAALPGVQSTALSSAQPGWRAAVVGFETADSPADGTGVRPTASTVSIDADYFATLGRGLVAGRVLRDAGDETSVVVNQHFANRQWPGENPLGKRIRLYRGAQALPWATVVGVAPNIAQSRNAADEGEPLIYRPVSTVPADSAWVIASAAGSPADLVTLFRRELAALDRDLPPALGPLPVSASLARKHQFGQTNAAMFGVLAAVAVLLAVGGLYAVVAQAVSRRVAEIGVRMAMGARPADIRALVWRQGAVPLLGGLVLGLAGSVALSQALQSQLVQVRLVDPLVLLVVSAALLLAAWLGCWIPMRRAMRVDPMTALRHE
jgi:predicted permease